MKPKAAIFLSGRVTGWQSCIKDFERAFVNYDYDIYCSLNCKEDDSQFLDFQKHPPVKKVRATLTHEYLDLSKMDMHQHHERYNMVSMFLHNKLAFELIEEEYDLYIRARNDFNTANIEGIRLFSTNIPLFSKDEISSKLWIPYCHRYGDYKFLMNDQFAISNYENMKKYCSLIDHIGDYKKEDSYNFSPETMLALHMDRQNLTLDHFAFDYFLTGRRHENAHTARDNEMWRFLTHMVNELGIKVE